MGTYIHILYAYSHLRLTNRVTADTIPCSHCRSSSYQTSHFWTGFMGDPSGQWKSLAKSFMLLSDPRTRNSDGECTPVVIRILRDSERINSD